MWIKGFIHQNLDEAFLATVQIVSKRIADHRPGVSVGYMEFTDGTTAEVYRHYYGGTYYGYITKEA